MIRILVLLHVAIGYITSTNAHAAVHEYEYSENIVEALERAEYLWRQNKIDQSLIEFENVIMMDETNLKGLSGIFRCHLKMGKLSEARDILESIQRISVDTKVATKLSKILDEAERVADQEAAEVFFQKQLEDFEVVKTEEKVPAEKALKRVISSSIKTPQGKFAKAIQLHKKGFTIQAIPIFMEAIMDEPNLLFANDYGLLNVSRDYYKRSTEASPKDVKSWFILAWISEQYADIENTKAVYTKIAEIAQKNSKEFLIADAKLIEISNKEKQIENARKLEQDRIQKDDERFRRIQISNGQYKEYSVSDYTVKGLEFYNSKNIPEAVIHLQGAIKVDPQNPETHYHYAMIQVESAFNGNENGFSIAKRELETCLNLEPDPALRSKALALLKTLNSGKSESNQ